MIVVSDTSPIHNLAAVEQLDLLRQLYDRVAIPSAVYQELLAAGETDPGALAVQTLDWIEVRSITNSAPLQELQAILDPGEAEAIALALELKAERLVIDERRGRQAASQRGLQVVGLLGVLLAAKQQGAIAQVQPILDALIAQGFWLRRAVYLEVLALAEEDPGG